MPTKLQSYVAWPPKTIPASNLLIFQTVQSWHQIKKIEYFYHFKQRYIFRTRENPANVKMLQLIHEIIVQQNVEDTPKIERIGEKFQLSKNSGWEKWEKRQIKKKHVL